MAKQKFDMYQHVTDQIIKSLESGVKPWECPWNRSSIGELPQNFISKKSYSGLNILLLWIASVEKNLTSRYWLTYKQIVDLGGNVKGQKGTKIIFYKTLEKENEAGETKKIPMLKSYTVFNADQIEGIVFPTTKPATLEKPVKKLNCIPHVEMIIEDTGARISEHGEKAFYRPSTDEIVMPEKKLFSNIHDFYAVLLHELTHWTGHKNRLSRDQKNTFGSKDYAFEELIAELGSAFLMADLNISGEYKQHENYIASWLKVLNDDKKFIFKAAAAASKAHQFIMTSHQRQNAA